MAVVKKIIKFLSTIVYILLFSYGILCLPMFFGYKPLVVLTGSMEPSIQTGGIIYYHKTNKDELKQGDVIVYSFGQSKVAHRINSIDETGQYETKGDANNTVDAVKVNYSNIEGKVAKVTIPYVGYYVRFVNEHSYIVIVAVIILVSEYLVSNTKAFDIDSKRKEKL